MIENTKELKVKLGHYRNDWIPNARVWETRRLGPNCLSRDGGVGSPSRRAAKWLTSEGKVGVRRRR